METGSDIVIKVIERRDMQLKYVRFEAMNHSILRHPNVILFKAGG